MISARKPFSDPEFLRSINVVPFDPEADAQLEKQAVNLATYRFWEAQAREEQQFGVVRGTFYGILFSVCFGGTLYLLWTIGAAL